VWWCPYYVTAVYVNNWSWHVHGSHSVWLLKPGVTSANLVSCLAQKTERNISLSTIERQKGIEKQGECVPPRPRWPITPKDLGHERPTFVRSIKMLPADPIAQSLPTAERVKNATLQDGAWGAGEEDATTLRHKITRLGWGANTNQPHVRHGTTDNDWGVDNTGQRSQRYRFATTRANLRLPIRWAGRQKRYDPPLMLEPTARWGRLVTNTMDGWESSEHFVIPKIVNHKKW
jgi:hypothetical protein